jgi:hypothetical protein
MAWKRFVAVLLVFGLITLPLGALKVYAASPTITGLNTFPVKPYTEGEFFNLTVVFDQNVQVVGGTPSLKLDVGGTEREALYSGGSGQYVGFIYTVQPGDNDADGIDVVGPIQLNGATIRNGSGEDAVLGTGFGTGGASVLHTSVLIDTTAPMIESVTVPADGVYRPGDELLFTVDFSENIVVNVGGGIPYLPLDIGGTQVRAEEFYTIGHDKVVFLYVIEPGLEASGITVGDEIKFYGGAIQDSPARNPINRTLPAAMDRSLEGIAIQPSIVTPVPPVKQQIPAPAIYHAGESIDFTVEYHEPVVVTGIPFIPLTVGSASRQANFLQATGNQATFRYTVQNGDEDANGIVAGSVINLNGGQINDGLGTPLSTAVYKLALADVQVDATIPQVTSVSIPANRNYTTGESFDFRLDFTEKVKVVDQPRLTLRTGSNGSVTQAVYAEYVSGSGTEKLIFRYTVQSSDLDTDGIEIGDLDRAIGSVVDLGGNPSNPTVAAPTSYFLVILNAPTPTITSVDVPSAGTYASGTTIYFTVHFSEAVTAQTAYPRMPITIGSSQVYALYHSGQGTNAITFQYTIQSIDSDTDGIALDSALYGNNGKLISLAGYGVQADLTLNSVGDTSGVLIGVQPEPSPSPTPSPTPSPSPEPSPSPTSSPSPSPSPEPSPSPSPEPPIKPAACAFEDINSSWAKEEICEAVALDILDGLSTTRFAPTGTITRGELAQALVQFLSLIEEKEKNSASAILRYKDQSDFSASETQAIAVATAQGWLRGYTDGSFRPQASITRSELLVVLARIAGWKTESDKPFTVFGDDSAIPVWARFAVYRAQQEGILVGKPSELFSPQVAATRAETAALFVRLYHYLKH